VALDARCTCGAVGVAVRGRVGAMFLCTCAECQKVTGGGHATVALFTRDAVRVEGPVTAFTRPAASGARLTRCFCPVCGTGVSASSSRAPDAVLLPVGLFGADTAWFAPRQVIFARSHRDWDALPEGLAWHETYREGLPE